MTPDLFIRRRPDGSIDTDACLAEGLERRSAAARDAFGAIASGLARAFRPRHGRRAAIAAPCPSSAGLVRPGAACERRSVEQPSEENERGTTEARPGTPEGARDSLRRLDPSAA